MSPGIATDRILLLSFHNFIAKAGNFDNELDAIIFSCKIFGGHVAKTNTALFNLVLPNAVRDPPGSVSAYLDNCASGSQADFLLRSQET